MVFVKKASNLLSIPSAGTIWLHLFQNYLLPYAFPKILLVAAPSSFVTNRTLWRRLQTQIMRQNSLQDNCEQTTFALSSFRHLKDMCINESGKQKRWARFVLQQLAMWVFLVQRDKNEFSQRYALLLSIANQNLWPNILYRQKTGKCIQPIKNSLYQCFSTWGREPFFEGSREDISCAQLCYICFMRVRNWGRWVIHVVVYYNGSRYKKVENRFPERTLFGAYHLLSQSYAASIIVTVQTFLIKIADLAGN